MAVLFYGLSAAETLLQLPTRKNTRFRSRSSVIFNHTIAEVFIVFFINSRACRNYFSVRYRCTAYMPHTSYKDKATTIALDLRSKSFQHPESGIRSWSFPNYLSETTKHAKLNFDVVTRVFWANSHVHPENVIESKQLRVVYAYKKRTHATYRITTALSQVTRYLLALIFFVIYGSASMYDRTAQMI